MIHFWNITRDQIRELRAEAAAFDDSAMVAICDHALGAEVASPSFVDGDGQLWRSDGAYCAIVAANRETSRRLIATALRYAAAESGEPYETGIAGIWTPHGNVLCLDCHGRKIRDREIPENAWKGRNDPSTPKGCEGLAPCDRCGRAVVIGEDLAMLCEIRDACVEIDDVPGFELRQTGGMCAALASLDEDRPLVVVTNIDGPIYVCAYRPGDEEWIDPLYQSEDLDGLEDVIAAIRVAYATPIPQE